MNIGKAQASPGGEATGPVWSDREHDHSRHPPPNHTPFGPGLQQWVSPGPTDSDHPFTRQTWKSQRPSPARGRRHITLDKPTAAVASSLSRRHGPGRVYFDDIPPCITRLAQDHNLQNHHIDVLCRFRYFLLSSEIPPGATAFNAALEAKPDLDSTIRYECEFGCQMNTVWLIFFRNCVRQLTYDGLMARSNFSVGSRPFGRRSSSSCLMSCT